VILKMPIIQFHATAAELRFLKKVVYQALTAGTLKKATPDGWAVPQADPSGRWSWAVPEAAPSDGWTTNLPDGWGIQSFRPSPGGWGSSF
jgi:hypothetical protein